MPLESRALATELGWACITGDLMPGPCFPRGLDGSWSRAEPEESHMPGIVCAVRGGPASKPTIARSISLARETGQTLHFLYVVNLDFMSQTSSSRVHTIAEQMEQMGEFILLMAQDAAARQGVEAKGAVRHGNVSEEIIGLCHDLGADYVVLGKPKVEQEDTVFTEERLHQFAAETEERCGAKVVFPE